MKIEQLDKYKAIDACSVFTFHSQVGSPPVDIIYGGSVKGNVFYISLESSSISKSAFVGEITASSLQKHRGSIQCIVCTFHPKICPTNCPIGIIITGGVDHTIKVWNPMNNSKPLLQTMSSHEGIVNSLADGNDGSIVSCSSDGTLKVWTIGSGRDDLLNPFFECKFSFSTTKGVWLTSLVVTTLKSWTCYVSDSEGNIDLFQKSSNSNDVKKYVMQYNQQLTKVTRFEKVHSLSITSIVLTNDEDILVTISSDGYCKLIDAKSGRCMVSIHNKRSARYVGAAWVSIENRLFITDELGYLEIFSMNKMVVVSTIQLLKQTMAEKSCTLASHKYQILSTICKARDDCHFYLLLPSAAGIQSNKSGAYSGEIVLWRLEVDQSVLNFTGHLSSVVSVSAYNHGTSSCSSLKKLESGELKYNRAAQCSRNECSLFTIGSDNIMRCWDEYDTKERYQIKMKSKGGEIISSLILWDLSMPSIATCHDDGCICIWNADSGNMVDTHVLKDSVLCLTEGIHNHCRFLIGADLSGKLAFINLTLFDSNPIHLSVDFIMQGYHNVDEPGIVSVMFHWKSATLFTGGNDRTIRYRRLSGDKPCCIEGHNDAVCFVESSIDFMLSGDESGEIILWRLIMDDKSQYIRKVQHLCKWPCIDLGGTRALCQLIQTNENTIYILQAGLIGRMIVWKVTIDYIHNINRRDSSIHSKYCNNNTITSNKKGFSNNFDSFVDEESDQSDDEVYFGYQKKGRNQSFHSKHDNFHDNNTRSFSNKSHMKIKVEEKECKEEEKDHKGQEDKGQEDKDQEDKDQDDDEEEEEFDYVVNRVENDDIKVSVIKYAEIILENVEPSVVQLTCSESRPSTAQSIDTSNDNSNSSSRPKYVYLGTTDGPVLRYDVDCYRL